MPTSDEQLSLFLAGEPPTCPQRQLQEDHEDAQQLVQKKHKRTRTAIRGEAMRTLEVRGGGDSLSWPMTLLFLCIEVQETVQ